jgi:hypothetical protein
VPIGTVCTCAINDVIIHFVEHIEALKLRNAHLSWKYRIAMTETDALKFPDLVDILNAALTNVRVLNFGRKSGASRQKVVKFITFATIDDVLRAYVALKSAAPYNFLASPSVKEDELYAETAALYLNDDMRELIAIDSITHLDFRPKQAQKSAERAQRQAERARLEAERSQLEAQRVVSTESC